MTAQPIQRLESKLTARYQTTVPESVRNVLGLKKLDKISYHILSNGQVLISRADSDEREADPVLEKFLSFLARDIENNPQHLTPINSDLVNRVQSLVGGVAIDLSASLPEEDE
ncbi:type II toxin-antitoxin system PrlF family antitoxin [Laspinema sp. D1]|uniref:Type II toxin-antitoxin system PrlF family antitoxin n=1 Tax=Laspinema palackyanum D2a TaxID=2953684 RepID=A0ABT2MZ93_9CYAN|nr:type II toxin-antitoxin system PrlF family antitoxin [Laspinema sp. D2a]